MVYRRISDDPCNTGDCPALFIDEDRDSRTVAVRGDLLPMDALPLDPSEAAVTVPALLVVSTAAALGGELTRVDLGRMWKTFAVDAFRIETRQEYHVPAEQPALDEFFRTGGLISHDGLPEWLDLVKANTAAGRTVRRVHTIRLPHTRYVRWELASQAAMSVPAGEDIRIVDLDAHPQLEIADDVWIFDDIVGVKMWQPSPSGIARATADEMIRYGRWRDEAWRVAVPVRAYLDGVRAA